MLKALSRRRRGICAALLVLAGCGAETNQTDPVINEVSFATDEAASTDDAGKMWITAERIDRHTCASAACGVVGTLDFRSAATPLERKGKWVRITKLYDASCVNGRSEYVDKGNAACTSDNGIVDGKFGEWIEARHLSSIRPADPAATAAADEQLVKDSDDFSRHRRAFVTAARALIERGTCTPADLQENGGFVKSSNHRDEPIYFTYCGGFTVANRIYLNAATGEIFR